MPDPEPLVPPDVFERMELAAMEHSDRVGLLVDRLAGDGTITIKQCLDSNAAPDYALLARLAEEAGAPIEERPCPVCGRAGFREARYLAGHVRSHDKITCENGCGRTDLAPQAMGNHRKHCPKRPEVVKHEAAVTEVRRRLERLLPETHELMLARVLKMLVNAPKRDGMFIVISDREGPWLVRPHAVPDVITGAGSVCLVLTVERLWLEGLLGVPSPHEADMRGRYDR